MRVGTAFRYDQLSSQVGTAQARMLAAQNRVTTGKRINAPSDDPSGTRQLLGIDEVRAGLAAYTKNLDVAKGALGSSESVYGDLGDLMQSAQTLALQGANSTLDPSARDNLASQVQSLQDRLVSLGNSQGPDGRSLFGGQLTNAKPFSVNADGTLAYAGNAIVPTMQTGPSERATVGETGEGIANAYAALAKLQTSLKGNDPVAISNVNIAELKTSYDSLVVARADVGRRMNAIESTRSDHERRDGELKSRASDVGEVDYASAIVDYTAAQSAYEAALQVASKGFSTGLMDFIR